MTLRNLFVIALSEQVSEVFRVEVGQTTAIVDGLTYDEHRGEGEMVVMDDLGEVFELTTIDFLVWPREMITGSHGRVLWILL